METTIAMAKLIQAFSTYGPKIDLIDPADPNRFMELITQTQPSPRAW